jgi:hypothetical protein
MKRPPASAPEVTTKKATPEKELEGRGVPEPQAALNRNFQFVRDRTRGTTALSRDESKPHWKD